VIVHGDGEQTRSFAHVRDVVNALAKTLETPECFGQVINLGSDREITINELAKLAIEITGSKSQIQRIAYEDAYGEGFEDTRRRVPCLDKAKRLLDYEITQDLRAIVADIASSFAAES
jgi:UDP-glucose 4-epimerase